MEVLGVIVAGIIIGLLGKLVAPKGRDDIPLWLTVLCGIAGVLIGWYIAVALGVEETEGVDWIRWIISIAAAAVVVVVASMLYTQRSGRSVARR
ncbi:MAG: GlsB/YeaQ/YmgE family stress response membrane protein [Actinomycetota bacterium]|nr:GlsB/YeaQ/YmgE family stress response membrane protein [Actinomycetota bacterium]MDQ3311544.1 GlsB/YeaQ/YmgE family stress response membrane protein [Actinomycetota bacterium]